MKELGIIGFGNFGRFMAMHLKKYFSVFVYDLKDISDPAKQIGVNTGSLHEIALKKIVVLSVPVQFLEGVLHSIKDYINPDTLVLDVSSVKKKPCELMRKILPKGTNILGMHPLFGPQSNNTDVDGQKIILCPVQIKDYSSIISFLEESLKLQVIIQSEDEHDRQMSYIQGLSHFISKALNIMELPDVPDITLSFQHLLKLRNISLNNSDELFYTIEKENPYSKNVRKKFIKIIKEIDKSL